MTAQRTAPRRSRGLPSSVTLGDHHRVVRERQPRAAVDHALGQQAAVLRVEDPDRRRGDALHTLAVLLRDARRHVRALVRTALQAIQSSGEELVGVGWGVGRSTGVAQATTPVSGSSPTTEGAPSASWIPPTSTPSTIAPDCSAAASRGRPARSRRSTRRPAARRRGWRPARPGARPRGGR